MKPCLDPGHGGADSGAAAHDILEKEPNLTVALEVDRILRRRGLPQVLLTRRSDIHVTLAARTGLANQAGADLFVSIHHNAAPRLADGSNNPGPSGYEIYHQHTGPESRWEESRRLARELHDRFAAAFPALPSRGLKTKSNRSGVEWFHVLRETAMPAVLVEAAFITNPGDAALIRDPAWLRRQAEAIAEGILQWYGAATSPEQPPAPPPPASPEREGRCRLGEWLKRIAAVVKGG